MQPPLAQILGDYLNHLAWIISGSVMEAFCQYRPDLVLLDVMLPGVDGLTLCREIRSQSQAR